MVRKLGTNNLIGMPTNPRKVPKNEPSSTSKVWGSRVHLRVAVKGRIERKSLRTVKTVRKTVRKVMSN